MRMKRTSRSGHYACAAVVVNGGGWLAPHGPLAGLRDMPWRVRLKSAWRRRDVLACAMDAAMPAFRQSLQGAKKMPRMTGGDAIVESLLRHGIDTMFGLPGVQVYGLFDALARNKNRIRLINARHEQTTAYMALGLRLCDRQAGGLHRGAGTRRDEHRGGAGHRLGAQRAGAVPDRPGAEPPASAGRAASCTRCRTSSRRCAAW